MKSISLLTGYIYLIFAIVTGIASNGFLKTTEGFTKLNPTIFCVSSIIICLFCISKAMTVIPVGFTYATYGGLTIAAVTEPVNFSPISEFIISSVSPIANPSLPRSPS